MTVELFIGDLHMVTLIKGSQARSIAKGGSPDCILLHNISWNLYEELRTETANRGIRMAYDGDRRELMTPGLLHEEYGHLFKFFVMALAITLEFKIKGVGSWTLKNDECEKAKEPDSAFYIASYERIRRNEIDLNVDPPPDLVFESEVSRSAIDSLNISAAIKVPEIWRYDGEDLHIHERQPDGQYLETTRSLSFPFLEPGEFVTWMKKADENDDDPIGCSRSRNGPAWFSPLALSEVD